MITKGSAIGCLVLVLIVVQFIGQVHADTHVKPISVELAVPDYVPEAASLQHRRFFFSGQPLRIRGEFEDLGSAQVTIRGSTSGMEHPLDILRTTPSSLRVDVPPEIPTDLYELTVTAGDQVYRTSLGIRGFTPEELQAPMQRGGGGSETPLSAAVLYTSEITCSKCYWESVLSGHPTDPNHLVLAGMAGRRDHMVSVSHDAGRTWSFAQLDWPQGAIFGTFADPNVLVTQDGVLLLSALTHVVHPRTGLDLTVGALWRGPVTASAFQGTLFKPVPESVRDLDGSVIDYPKLAYDQITGTILISGWGVRFNDGTIGTGLIKSGEGGAEPFMEFALPRDVKMIRSLDTTSLGTLRGVSSRGAGVGKDFKVEQLFLRFGADLARPDIITFRPPFTPCNIGRVSTTSNREWGLYGGPELAIDKSTRHPGRIYMLYTEVLSCEENPPADFESDYYALYTDLLLSWSDNDGETWSLPTTIDPHSHAAYHAFPNIEIDSTGVVHIAYIDTHENSDLPQYDVYYTKVVDGQPSRSIRVNPVHISNKVGGYYPGDYMDVLQVYPERAYVSYPCAGNDYVPQNACITAVDPNQLPLAGEFKRGDSNADLVVDISDAISVLRWLFLGAPDPDCIDAADVNDDGKVDVSDPIRLLNYLFSNAPQPPDPFPNFGRDSTPDSLMC